MCTYVRNPEYDEEYARSLELDRIQYHQFQDIRRRNSDNSIAGRVTVTVSAEYILVLVLRLQLTHWRELKISFFWLCFVFRESYVACF